MTLHLLLKFPNATIYKMTLLEATSKTPDFATDSFFRGWPDQLDFKTSSTNSALYFILLNVTKSLI